MSNPILFNKSSNEIINYFKLPLTAPTISPKNIEDSFKELKVYMARNPNDSDLLTTLQAREKSFKASKILPKDIEESILSIADLARKLYKRFRGAENKKVVFNDTPPQLEKQSTPQILLVQNINEQQDETPKLEKKSLTQTLLEINSNEQQIETPELIEARESFIRITTNISIDLDKLNQKMGIKHPYTGFCSDYRKVMNVFNKLNLNTLRALTSIYAIEAPNLKNYVEKHFPPVKFNENETLY